jgi:sortase (surface protein transpeptidase)
MPSSLLAAVAPPSVTAVRLAAIPSPTSEARAYTQPLRAVFGVARSRLPFLLLRGPPRACQTARPSTGELWVPGDWMGTPIAEKQRRDGRRTRGRRQAKGALLAFLLAVAALAGAGWAETSMGSGGEYLGNASPNASARPLGGVRTAAAGADTREDLWRETRFRLAHRAAIARAAYPGAANAEAADAEDANARAAVEAEQLGLPVRVRIPEIGVDSPLVGVGLKANREMVVPDGGAGWYDLGPKPGAPGPAVLVAHRSWQKRPGAFHRLNELGPDDVVEVLLEDGRVARFAVEASETRLKTELPVERIWNEADSPVLRLITCGGSFDTARGRYRSNIIVYASLVEIA